VEHPVPEGVSEALALVEKDPAQLAMDLQSAGMLSIVGLNPDALDPDVSMERWRSVGVLFGVLYAGSRWALGDWINWGERVFGDEAIQEVETTVSERYDEAQRVTGLAPGTLHNIASVCSRVAFSRRRAGVPFEIHNVVAPLPPDEQTFWLDRVVNENLTRDGLRDLLNPKEPAEPAEPAAPRKSRSERIEETARLVWHRAQPSPDGGYHVESEAMSQLAAALGEE
jgi:hypothetical protein